jgi:murein DD-endopeptidase MepM/ murein hydrolase activator NlpD
MQENDKSYTFLLKHSFKSRIYIKRVEVSKKLLRNSLFSFALFIGLFAVGAGVSGVINNSDSIDSYFAGIFGTKVEAQTTAALTTQTTLPGSINYSRPADSKNVAFNSGGPFSNETNSEDAEMDRQLAVIQSTADPAFIPSIWAHMGKINNEFGFRRNPFGGRTYEFHAGMDIDGERGDLVVAPANGTITEAGWKGGYGNMVEIDHGNGLKTRYGHLSKIGVEIGDQVTRGALIAFIGSTGRSTGPHLHYELRFNDKPINPRRFLPAEPTELTGLN